MSQITQKIKCLISDISDICGQIFFAEGGNIRVNLYTEPAEVYVADKKLRSSLKTICGSS